jgi:iron complex outermembrane receptor protein
LVASLPARAQNGQISGTAKDQHGAAIVGATVQITNQATAHKTVVKTDSEGSYTAANLPAGHYLVAVSAPGFASIASTALNLAEGQSLSYDVQLKIASAMSTVNVNAHKEGSVGEGYKPTTAQTTGPWGTLQIQDTPYSINVMSADLIENLNVTSVDDFYRVDPVIQQNLTSRYFVNSDGEELRGFQQTPSTGGRFEDGMRSSWAPPSFEDVDRVEVYTGLTGFLYGANHVGGMINYITKKPTDALLTNLTVGSEGHSVLTHADVGGPITQNNKFGYRLSLATQNAPAGIDGISRQLGTLALNWHARKNLLADFGYSYQRTTVLGTTPTWWGFTDWSFVPDQSKYWGQP